MLKVFTNIRSKLKYFHLFTRDLWNKYTWVIHSLGTFWQLSKLLQTEEVAQRCSVKKVFFNISQNSQENTNAKISSYKPAIDFFLWILQNLRKTCFENIWEWVLLFFVTINFHKFPENLFSKECFKNFVKCAHQNKSTSSSKCKLWERYSNNLSSSRQRFKLKMHLLLHYSISTRFRVSIVSGS